MQEIVRRLAHLSVIRGCGFGLLAIVTSMVGMGDDMALALKWGGIAMLLMSFILLLKAARAHQVPFRSTEVWIMIPDGQRPPDAMAAEMIAEARRQALLIYAYRTAVIAGILLALDMIIVALR